MRADREGYLSLHELFRMEWSTRMVWKTLGQPDLATTREPFPKRPASQLYLRERVERAGAGARFQVLRLTDIIAHHIQFNQGLERCLDRARSTRLRLHPPGLDWEGLKRAGLRHRRETLEKEMPDREEPESYATLAAYSYIKHELTNYEEICNDIRGRPFARYSYPVILHRVNRLILELYPQCLPRVKGARQDPLFQCRKCRKTREGAHNGYYYEKPQDWTQCISPDRLSIWVFCSRTCSIPRRI